MLSRKTQNQLLRELLVRCAMPAERRPSPLVWPLTVLFTVLALYVYANL